MIYLTEQEKKVLLFVVVVLGGGLLLETAGRLFPRLSRAMSIVADDSFYPKVNVNSASLDELVAVPRIGPALAGRIVEARSSGRLFRSAADLSRAGIGEAGQKRLAKYLSF